MIDNHQLKAVELHDCSALLLAGPGCGKTHILARRIFHANTVRGVPFEDMLCLTFTNRAAREMERRVREFLGASTQGLFIGNIHSFCFRFLHANRIAGPDVSVMDEEDVTDYLDTAFGIKEARAIKDFLDKAAYVYQLEHDHPDSVVRRPLNHPTEDDYERIEAYSRYKEENRLLDYDDILRLTYTALLDEKADSYIMSGYRWLQVDEVQDMTPLQLAIIDALCVRHHRTALYLGDEQQAIFGFLGAGGRALDTVKRECSGHILRLQRNYRSPDYLVRLCNGIAERYLGIDREFLPHAVWPGDTSHPLLTWSGDNGTLMLMAAAQARRLLAENPDENVAILVHTNSRGQETADLLAAHGFDFFHVSRPDIFHRASFKTLRAHLGVVLRPTRHQEWARLLYQTRSVRTLGASRQLMNLLRESAMTGDELFSLDRQTAVEAFTDIFGSEERTVVVFDTETTGLDVFRDDVIQIAAIKLHGGKEVADGRFCVFIRTERPIPRVLADGTENPMRQAYAEAEPIDANEALAAFAAFVGDSVLAGHNLRFDTAIIRHNFVRRTEMAVPPQFGAETSGIDSLHLSRLLLPSLRSHRLGDLLDVLGVSGVNSHNALDDVAATVSLLGTLLPIAMEKVPRQRKIKSNANVRKAAMRLSAAYEELYRATVRDMECDAGSLAEALRESRLYFAARGYIGPIRHFEYLLDMVDRCVVDKESERNLKSQTEAHLDDLSTYNESDLFANGIVSERLSIMTVHKAKGLEMDNVILLDASSRPGSERDYARLLYVACSRARKRLYIGRTPWKSDSMLATVLSAFEEVPQPDVALAVRRENARRF